MYLTIGIVPMFRKYEKHTHKLGPLHTQAKSRDHEIVRVQKKVSKGHPKTPPQSCTVVMDPQV